MADNRVAYPNLSGDLDAAPELLRRLDALAARLRKRFVISSGARTDAEQVALWNRRASNPNPVAMPRSLGGGGSNHESGKAADVIVDGRPIQDALDADVLRDAGLAPLAGDPVHVELAGDAGGRGGVGVGGFIENAARHTIPGADGALNLIGVGGDAAADVAGDAASATARAMWGLVVDAIGRDGARVLLSVALVGVAVALIGFGGARALGLRTPPIPVPALAAARALKGAK